MAMTDRQFAMTLTEAYHGIYDVKDENLDNESVKVAAYHTLLDLKILMGRVGVEVPKRFDGEGRR